MYLDLHTWSASEPERWAHWVAPCPIRPGEFAEAGKRERRRLERTHQRTRARQPLLPILVAHVAGRFAPAPTVGLGRSGRTRAADHRRRTRLRADLDRLRPAASR